MFTGSFRLVAGSQHLHWRYSFTGSLAETAAKSLRHSCRSELTRQGISLSLVTFLKERVSRFGSAHLCMSPCSSDHLILQPSGWRSGVWPLRILRTAIHSTSQLSDPSQPLRRQMLASLHEANHLSEAFETRSLHRPQWSGLEERYHSFGQLLESSDAEFFSIAVIDGNLTAPEELAKLLEEGDIPLVLDHAELWKDLPADLHRGLPIHADVEATFTVDETDHPSGTQAFL